MANLAVFDLDQTLIPFDSDIAWITFLAEKGLVDVNVIAEGFKIFGGPMEADTLDSGQFLEYFLPHALLVDPREVEGKTVTVAMDQLAALYHEFLSDFVLPQITPEAKAMVQQHLDASDLCVMSTATNTFIAGPICEQFGIEHLIAVELGVDSGGRYSGEFVGKPNYGSDKVERLNAWLTERGLAIESFAKSYFYSDSSSDLPLLNAVTHPVVVNPNQRLLSAAFDSSWAVQKPPFSHTRYEPATFLPWAQEPRQNLVGSDAPRPSGP